jgi:hypothetical protein
MKRLEMIDSVPVFLEEATFYGGTGCYLQFWGGCDKVTFSDNMEEEELLKLLDIVTEFVNKSLELKKGEAQ